MAQRWMLSYVWILLIFLTVQPTIMGQQSDKKTRIRWKDTLTSCPVCQHQNYFGEVSVQDPDNIPLATDELGRVLALYEPEIGTRYIWSCPHCGYTAVPSTFSKITPEQVRRLPLPQLKWAEKMEYYDAIPILLRLHRLMLCDETRQSDPIQEARNLRIIAYHLIKQRNNIQGATQMFTKSLEKERTAYNQFLNILPTEADKVLQKRWNLIHIGILSYFLKDTKTSYDSIILAKKEFVDPVVELTLKQQKIMQDQNLIIQRYQTALEKGSSILSSQ